MPALPLLIKYASLQDHDPESQSSICPALAAPTPASPACHTTLVACVVSTTTWPASPVVLRAPSTSSFASWPCSCSATFATHLPTVEDTCATLIIKTSEQSARQYFNGETHTFAQHPTQRLLQPREPDLPPPGANSCPRLPLN